MSITQTEASCGRCGWRGTVRECEPDADGDLCCPECGAEADIPVPEPRKLRGLRELLGELSKLITSDGPDSLPVRDFIEQHSENEEFRHCAPICQRLAREIASRT